MTSRSWSYSSSLMLFVGFLASCATSSPYEQPSYCSPDRYTSRIGISFETMCDFYFKDAALSEGASTSLKDCMEQCADSRPTCYGVSFSDSKQYCWLRNSSVFTAVHVQDNMFSSALVNATQMLNKPLDCEYPNKTDHSSSDGMAFTILCHQDMAWGDYYAKDIPPIPHVDSLEECMEVCSHAHPLCRAVVYNPDMTNGYGNCYLKDKYFDVEYVHEFSNHATYHMAVKKNTEPPNSTCVERTMFMTNDGKRYNVMNCTNSLAGNDLTSLHAQDIPSCIEHCSSYSNSSTKPCVAVVFDSTLVQGWQNCYLKSAVGNASVTTGSFVLSAAVNSSSPLASTPATASPRSSSKAWVAGPVLGGMAAVAILAGFLVWRHRRNRRRQAAAIYQQPVDEGDVVHRPQETGNLGVAELSALRSIQELSDTSELSRLVTRQDRRTPQELQGQ